MYTKIQCQQCESFGSDLINGHPRVTLLHDGGDTLNCSECGSMESKECEECGFQLDVTDTEMRCTNEDCSLNGNK